MVGSNVPPVVKALDGPSVRVTGWVEELLPLYRSSRVGIAPLRYGAGVKGKVGEALSLGLPMAMTSIAAEGMHIQDGVTGMVSDDPAGLADRIVQLMADDDLWRRLSARGRELISERFGPRAAQAAILGVLREARRSPITQEVPA